MFNFPLKYKDKLIQIEDALDIISYAIKFIEANYNCNLEKYQITVEVLSKLIQAIKGISDHKPPKEKIIKAIETIEEIAKKDGFNSVEDFLAFFKNQYGNEFFGLVIRWGKISKQK